jgi:hypothetical protein
VIAAAKGGDGNWELLLTIGLLVALAMVLTFRLMHRDSAVRRTRYGFFVERDRFQDDAAEEWPQQPDDLDRTLPQWPPTETPPTREAPP